VLRSGPLTITPDASRRLSSEVETVLLGCGGNGFRISVGENAQFGAMPAHGVGE
jgi:hypothetical protein